MAAWPWRRLSQAVAREAIKCTKHCHPDQQRQGDAGGVKYPAVEPSDLLSESDY